MNHLECRECIEKRTELIEEKCCGHGLAIGIKCVGCGKIRAPDDPPYACLGAMSAEGARSADECRRGNHIPRRQGEPCPACGAVVPCKGCRGTGVQADKKCICVVDPNHFYCAVNECSYIRDHKGECSPVDLARKAAPQYPRTSEARPRTCENPATCREGTAFRLVGDGIEARFCVTCDLRYETRAVEVPRPTEATPDGAYPGSEQRALKGMHCFDCGAPSDRVRAYCSNHKPRTGHPGIGAGGGDDDGYIHPDALASQSPEFQAQYELAALRKVAEAAAAIERIGTFANQSGAVTSPRLTAALDEWRAIPQADDYASEEIHNLREAAKMAHEAWTCDPDAASTRACMARLESVARLGLMVDDYRAGAPHPDYPRPEGEPDYPNAILVGASGLLDSRFRSATRTVHAPIFPDGTKLTGGKAVRYVLDDPRPETARVGDKS